MIGEYMPGRYIQPEKIYFGWYDRNMVLIMRGNCSAGEGCTFVTVNGLPLRAFNIGGADFFEWGCDSTESRMLAIAILADYFGGTPTREDYGDAQKMAGSNLNCMRYCQRFLFVLMNLARGASWTISSDHIREWLKSLKRQDQGAQ